MGLLLLTIAVIAATMLVMAVGIILSNRCLRGTCGGAGVTVPGDEPIHCDQCPNRPAETARETASPAAGAAARDNGRQHPSVQLLSD
jgi:hypothetical protein